MKKITMLLLLVLSFSFQQALAQPGRGNGRGPGQNPERQLQTLKDTLALTPVQVDSIKSILADFQPKLKEVFNDPNLSRDERRDAIRRINAQRNVRIKKQLTKEQRQKFNEFEKRRRQQADDRIKERFGTDDHDPAE